MQEDRKMRGKVALVYRSGVIILSKYGSLYQFLSPTSPLTDLEHREEMREKTSTLVAKGPQDAAHKPQLNTNRDAPHFTRAEVAACTILLLLFSEHHETAVLVDLGGLS